MSTNNMIQSPMGKFSATSKQLAASRNGKEMNTTIGGGVDFPGSSKTNRVGGAAKSGGIVTIEPDKDGNEVQKELFGDLYTPPHRRVLKRGQKSASESDLSVLSSGFGSMSLSSTSLTASLVSVDHGKGKGKGSKSASSRDLEGDWRASPGSWSSSPGLNGLGGAWSSCGSVSSESSVLEIKVRPRGEKDNSSPDPKSDEATDGGSDGFCGLGGIVNIENAQAILPPSACVFVANLPFELSDEELTNRIQNVFSQFGEDHKCWTIVRRDDHNNPFAFVQYISDEEACRAVLNGRGIDIGGRAIRTEEAKANRLYFFSKHSGEMMPIDEAIQALKPMGGIDEIWKATESDMARHRIGRGFFVKATYYTKAREAIHTFNRSETYRLIPMNCTPKSARRLDYALPVHSPTRPRKRPHIPDDDRSIFIGGLPVDTTEAQLAIAFGAYQIISVQICQRASRFPDGKPNCFGFVEFMTKSIKLRAALEMDGMCFPGTGLPMKVKFKTTNPPPVLTPRPDGENESGASPARGSQDEYDMSPIHKLLQTNGSATLVNAQDGGNVSAQQSSPLGNDRFMMNGLNGRGSFNSNGLGLYSQPGNFDGGMFHGNGYGHPTPGQPGFMGQSTGLNHGFGNYMESPPILPTPQYMSPQPGLFPVMQGMQYNGTQPCGQFFGQPSGPLAYAGQTANAAHLPYGSSAHTGATSYGAVPGFGPAHNGSSQFGAPPPYGATSGYGVEPAHHGSPSHHGSSSQYGAPPAYSPPPAYPGQFNAPAPQWAGYNGNGGQFQPQSYVQNYGHPATGPYAYPPQAPVFPEVASEQGNSEPTESTEATQVLEALSNVELANIHEQASEVMPQVDAAVDNSGEQ